MMGVDSRLPYTPPLLMVKVPPAMSSMLMVPSRAFLPSSVNFCERHAGAGDDGQAHLKTGHATLACYAGVAAAGAPNEPMTLLLPMSACASQRTFSHSAKLSSSALRSTGTTSPLGVATAMEMST
jgi:hypothetical protein